MSTFEGDLGYTFVCLINSSLKALASGCNTDYSATVCKECIVVVKLCTCMVYEAAFYLTLVVEAFHGDALLVA